MFAQESIKQDEVERELLSVRSAIGSGVDVTGFTTGALAAHNAVVQELHDGRFKVDLSEAPDPLREAVGKDKFQARFEMPVKEGVIYLHRTHPIVEALAAHVMDTALDALTESKASRAGVIRTSLVKRRTTLLLVRFRYHIITKKGEDEQPLLAEDCLTLAFEGSPSNAEWLADVEAERLLLATAEENINADQARDFIQKVLDDFGFIAPRLDQVAQLRGNELLDAHRRVRVASGLKGVSHRVEPKLPPDVLGIYVYLPKI